jgi:SAM-dependent methyltransferase
VPMPADREVSVRRPRRRPPEIRVRVVAQRVADALRAIDGEARQVERTVPTGDEREKVGSIFWHAMREFEAIDRTVDACERARCAAAARELLHPWLLRSDHWSRGYLKPHGYVGDFRTLERIYDLERDRCSDPTKPVVVNLADYLYRTVDSVHAVWHRRRWYAELVGELLAIRDSGRPVRVLDLACGGSRYTRDVLGNETPDGSVELTFFDEDPAALMFIRRWLPSHLRAATRFICGPVHHFPKLVLDSAGDAFRGFDLVISTGLCDSLGPAAAGALLLHMTRLTRPGGLVAVSNFAPEDGSRIVKDWIVEWSLMYRSVSVLRELVPEGHSVGFDRSPDGGLVHALVSVRSGPHRGRRVAR